jgi:hypothetical protein
MTDETIDLDLVQACLRSALAQITRGQFRRAQINVEYARDRMITALGELPPDSDARVALVMNERWKPHD